MLASSGNIGAARLCPHLGLIGDSSTACLFVSDSHRCFRLETPETVMEGEQAEHCISGNYSRCPRFQGIDAKAGSVQPRRAFTGRGLPGGNRRLFASGVLVGLAVVALAITWGVLSGASHGTGQGAAGPTGSASAPGRSGQGTLPPTVAGSAPTTPPTPPAQSVASSVSAASRTPTVTRTPGASGGQKVYVVSSGETLWGIAVQHGISVEDLMAANGLTDRGYVQAGQRLVIPAR